KGGQETEERHTKQRQHRLIQRFRVLLMGLLHHIFMTDLSTGDGRPPLPEDAHAIHDASPLEPKSDEPVGFSPRLTHRTGAGGSFGTEFVATVHAPALLVQTPLVVGMAEDILPHKDPQTCRAARVPRGHGEHLASYRQSVCSGLSPHGASIPCRPKK